MERIPLQGEIWNMDFNPVRGHGQGGFRPALVLSRSDFNGLGLELIVVVAVSTKSFISEVQVVIDPPMGGVTERSYMFAHQIRTVSTDRLIRRRGRVSAEVFQAVMDITVPMISMPLVY